MIRQSVGGLAKRSCVFIKTREARSSASVIIACKGLMAQLFLLGTPRDEYSL
jgi:hypothetical protein